MILQIALRIQAAFIRPVAFFGILVISPAYSLFAQEAVVTLPLDTPPFSLSVLRNPDPTPDLMSFTVSAHAEVGGYVNVLADIELSGLAHQAWGLSGNWPSPTDNSFDVDWMFPEFLDVDTHMLISELDINFIFGELEELNDFSNPTDLAIAIPPGSNDFLNGAFGLGGISLVSDADFSGIGLFPDTARTSFEFLQVVVPKSGPYPTLSIQLLGEDGQGDSQVVSFTDFSIVPEPSLIALIGMSVICVLLSCRSQYREF